MEELDELYEELNDSMCCDLYGFCCGASCPNYINCSDVGGNKDDSKA